MCVYEYICLSCHICRNILRVYLHEFCTTHHWYRFYQVFILFHYTHVINSVDQITSNDVDGAYGTYRGEMLKDFLW
jgi:hypothetical protein